MHVASPLMSRIFTVILAASLILAHVDSLATPVSDALPIALSSTDEGFEIANTSKTPVFVTWRLSGSNFRADRPCEGATFLPPGAVSAVVSVKARDRTRPLDYRVTVTRLETKSLDDMRREVAASKNTPASKPLSTSDNRAADALRCQR